MSAVSNATHAAESQSAPPAASLIICSRNRPALLAETVESILAGEVLPAELLVVDQSDDPHPALARWESARGCQLRYLWKRDAGISRARNAGIAAARQPILAFTDDDMFAPVTWFGSLIHALCEAGPRSVVTGQVRPEAAREQERFVPSTIADEAPAAYAGRIGKDVLFTGNMALYRPAIDEVGGFDERLGPGTDFSAAEDNDLGFRLLERGFRIVYAPQAMLYHRAWRSTDDYLSLRWRYGRGQGAYYAKHLSLCDRHMFWRLAASVKGHTMQCIWCMRRRRHEAYGHAIYVAGLLWGAVQWRLTQHRSS
jgi:GT2 family glycosyltransferase